MGQRWFVPVGVGDRFRTTTTLLIGVNFSKLFFVTSAMEREESENKLFLNQIVESHYRLSALLTELGYGFTARRSTAAYLAMTSANC
jgi:hypothetical protein